MITVTIPKADKGYTLTLTALDDAGAAKSLAGYTVNLKTWLPATPDTAIINSACTITDATHGICTYTLGATDFATSNVYHARLVCTKTGYIEALKPFVIVVEGGFYYCSMSEIKLELFTGQTADVNDYDSLIETLCEEVKGWVDDYCGRSFTSSAATKYFDGAGILFIDDLISIDALGFQLDEDADGAYESTLATTDYILYPLNTTPKTIIKPSPWGNYGGFASGVKKGVKIIGTWGYDFSVPKAVRRAAKIQTCRLFKRREAAYAPRVSLAELGETRVYAGLDPDVKLLLESYRRKSI